MSSSNPAATAILESIEYLEEVRFQKYWLILKRRWFVIALIAGSVFGASVVWTSRQVPLYEATGKLLFKADKTSALVGIRTDSGNLQALTTKSDPLTTEAEILRSLPIAQAAVKNLQDSQGEPLDPQVVIGNLTVKPVVGTDILQITYKSDDPELASEIVNQLMKAYIENNIVVNRQEAVAARKFIMEQLPETEASVNQAETNLRQFKEANGIVVLSKEADASVEGLSTLNKVITEAQAELVRSNARVNELRNQVGMDASAALALNSLNQSEGVQKAITELQQVQTQLAKQETLYQAPHPAVTQLQRQEASAKAVLQDRVTQILGANLPVDPGNLQLGTTRQDLVAELAKAEVERFSLAQRLNSLSQSQGAFEARSRSIPALEKMQRELERKLDAAQTTYKTLLTRLQEVQVAENQNVGNARVVAGAEVPTTPVSPRVLINLLAGGVLGVLLGIAAAFLLDYADQSVKTLQEARELFQYTLLGVIPTIESNRLLPSNQAVPKLITRDRPHFAAQEAYQMLHANLRFLTSDHPIQTIVVTSTVRKEGKSTVAANLAAAIAQVNRRVLLVDADLRHPCQHHVWDLNNTLGLSNVIVGQATFSQAVQAVTSHLHVLTAGVIPPNPIALLDSQRMASLLRSLAQNYDMVILDSPSLSGTADAAVLNKMADGSLLVVRPGTIKAGDGKAAKQFLAQSGQTVLGMVVNHFDIRKEPDSYFYYTKDYPSEVQSEQDRTSV